MSKPLDDLNNPQGSIDPMPSMADVLREYLKLELPPIAEEMPPLDAETLEVLRRVDGHCDPLHLAVGVSSALRTLWVARKSGELSDEDGDSTLLLLSEVTGFLEHVIEVHQSAAWRQAQHEKALIRAEQSKAKPTTRRRKAEEGGT